MRILIREEENGEIMKRAGIITGRELIKWVLGNGSVIFKTGKRVLYMAAVDRGSALDGPP